MKLSYPVTPDGRYFVVRGRLWRCRDPGLPPDVAAELVSALMAARRALRGRQDDAAAASLHARVDEIKRALGERGPAWWTDGAPDHNRRLVKKSPYAAWFQEVVEPSDETAQRGRKTTDAARGTR